MIEKKGLSEVQQAMLIEIEKMSDLFKKSGATITEAITVFKNVNTTALKLASASGISDADKAFLQKVTKGIEEQVMRPVLAKNIELTQAQKQQAIQGLTEVQRELPRPGKK